MNHKQFISKIQSSGDSIKGTIPSTHKAWKRAIMATSHLAATLLHSQIKERNVHGAMQKVGSRGISMQSFPEAHSLEARASLQFCSES